MAKIIIIVSGYKLPDDDITNFINRNREPFEKNNIEVTLVLDRILNIPDKWVNVIVYPKELKKYAPSKTINYGIKHTICEADDIIIKTDIDIYYTDDIIQHIKNNISYNNGMICFCSYTPIGMIPTKASFANWHKIKKHGIKKSATGACFVMTKQDWYDFKGYDERLKGWGHEDTEMYIRASRKINIIESIEYPLYHIGHPKRITRGRRSYWPNDNWKNGKISRNLDWNDEKWGEAQYD